MAAPAMSSGRPIRFSGRVGGDLCPEGLERGRHHLGLEGPRRDGVDGDRRGQALGQVPGQLVHGRLRRRVRVRLEHRHVDPVDGPDVDDAGRLLDRARPPRAAAAGTWSGGRHPSRSAPAPGPRRPRRTPPSGAPQVAPALLTRMSSTPSPCRQRVGQPAAPGLGGEVGGQRQCRFPAGDSSARHLGTRRRPCATRCRPWRRRRRSPWRSSCRCRGSRRSPGPSCRRRRRGPRRSSAHCARRGHGAANASALRTRTLAPTRSASSSTRKVGLWCMPLEPSAAPPPTKK